MLVTGAALGLMWALVRGNAAGWGSAETIVSLAAGALLAIAFVAWEGRTRAPMVPMRLFRSGAFSSGSVGIFCLNASLAGPVFLMTQFQQVALGQGPSTPVCACCPGGR